MSIADAEPRFDLFISYAHKDNASRQVRELRDAIVADFESFAGRPLKEFFDEDDIPSMAAWEKRIAKGLHDSRLFLAILSPNYFASPYCRREWEEYIRYEAMRQCLGEGVAPVYFVELPGLDGPGVEQKIDHWVDELRKRQWCDIRPWHNAGRRALKDAHVAERLKVLKSEIKVRLRRADRAKQSPTNIYRHNPQFVGRVRELTLLREALNERGSVGVVGNKVGAASPGATTVHGIGGMGKTELALAYAHAFAWDYPGGRWLARCEGVDDFDLVLRQFAEPLHVEFTEDEQKNLRLAGERILAELRRRDRSLLMLDNVTDTGLFGPDVLMRLPPQGHVHVIATTRLGPVQIAGSPHDHTFVAVDELPAEDALALIRAHQLEARFASDVDEVAGKELVALLSGFTLAVETAAIYLGRHSGSETIASYAARLRRRLLTESEASAADPVVAVRHKERLLEHTLAVTFETLAAEELHVLTLGALLPADQIALPWLRAVAGYEFRAICPDDSATDDSAWRRHVESLVSLRLFHAAGVTDVDGRLLVVRMHRLVQEVVKISARLSIADAEKAILSHTKTRALVLLGDWINQALRWEISPLVECASLWLERQLPEAIDIGDALVIPLESFARYSEAERIVRLTLAAKEQRAANDVSIAVTIGNLAEVLQATNRLNEAESMIRRALSMLENAGQSGSPFHAIALNNLAQILHDENRFGEAEPVMLQAVSAFERSFGTNDPRFTIALNNLSQLLADTGRHANAEPLMRRALAFDEKFFGPKHARVAIRLNNLAKLLQTTKRASEAGPLFLRALAIDEECFGPNHPHVAIRLNNLADLLKDTERQVEAEAFAKRALGINESCFGPEHPTVALSLLILARIKQRRGRLDQAESLIRRGLRINERSFGEDHEILKNDLLVLALVLGMARRFRDAEPVNERLLILLLKAKQRTGKDPPWLHAVMQSYATCLYENGHELNHIKNRLEELDQQFV